MRQTTTDELFRISAKLSMEGNSHVPDSKYYKMTRAQKRLNIACFKSELMVLKFK